MAEVYLRYIGKKKISIDTVGGTGVIWNGNGDIQPVLDTAAEKLLKYPDQWEVATVKEALEHEQQRLEDEFDDGGAVGETVENTSTVEVISAPRPSSRKKAGK